MKKGTAGPKNHDSKGRKAMVTIEYRLPGDCKAVKEAADRISNETRKVVAVIYRPKHAGQEGDISYHEPGSRFTKRVGRIATGSPRPLGAKTAKLVQLLRQKPRTRKELAVALDTSETNVQTYFVKLARRGVKVVCLYDYGRSRYTVEK